jgi:hypothetical protein
VACPSGRQCTAVDLVGQEVTFDPETPAIVSPVTVDSAAFRGLAGVACPSLHRCTAIGDGSPTHEGKLFPHEVTFDPEHPGARRTAPIGPKRSLLDAIACPSMDQCTTVDDAGSAVTFNPAAPSHATTTRIERRSPLALACPTQTQCTVLDEDGLETTFNPRAPAHRSTFELGGAPDGGGLACPTVHQCTATVGGISTFDPRAPKAHRLVVARNVHGTAIACSTSHFCVVAGNRVSQGDPTRPGSWMTVKVAIAYPPAVGCSSHLRCVLVDAAGDDFHRPS